MIELLFAMSFVSVLLIIILTATLSITRIYNKGITLKQVNQAGASVASELQTSMKAADAPVSTSALGRGRLCLGTYSYVWNTPTVTPANTLSDGSPLVMVKVTDPSASMCAGTYPKPTPANARELVAANGEGLVLRSVDVARTGNLGTDYLYHVAFTVSTDDGSLISSGVCKGGASDEFCALNSFDFTVFMKQGGSGKV